MVVLRYLTLLYGEVHLSDILNKTGQYIQSGVLSKALVAAPHHVSLAFYQMSRAAQASGSAGSITRIPGVVASNVAMYPINLMSDSWPEVLTATHRVFDQ